MHKLHFIEDTLHGLALPIIRHVIVYSWPDVFMSHIYFDKCIYIYIYTGEISIGCIAQKKIAQK